MATKPNLRGRPPLPRNQVCDHRVVTFLNDSTHRQVEQLSRRGGKSISQVCRELIVAAIETPDAQNESNKLTGEKP